jgi:hypothetical protein
LNLIIKVSIITYIVKMATPVIKLAPIRMGDLMSTSSSTSYVPPHLRGTIVKDEIATVGDDAVNFPSLGIAPRKASGWKQAVHTEPVIAEIPVVQATVPTMNDKIKDIIRQTELEELERQKPREEDPNKMTREELLADGWVILSLKSADEVRLRLNSL